MLALSSTFSVYVPAFTDSASSPFCFTSIVNPGPVSPSSVPEAEAEAPPPEVVSSLDDELPPPHAAAPSTSIAATSMVVRTLLRFIHLPPRCTPWDTCRGGSSDSSALAEPNPARRRPPSGPEPVLRSHFDVEHDRPGSRQVRPETARLGYRRGIASDDHLDDECQPLVAERTRDAPAATRGEIDGARLEASLSVAVEDACDERGHRGVEPGAADDDAPGVSAEPRPLGADRPVVVDEREAVAQLSLGRQRRPHLADAVEVRCQALSLRRAPVRKRASVR